MKFMIITNHSYMLWQFRRELIQELLRRGEVVISMPFVGHEEDFRKLGCECIETDVDRRSVNPIGEIKLYNMYKQLLQDVHPDVVITYSIKPNIYAGYGCGRLGIPCFVNVQGLGTAFWKEPFATVVSAMYRKALKKVKTVFFENQENATLFLRRRIMPEEKQVVVHGAGVNLEYYQESPYPKEQPVTRMLFVGRIMKEKGVDEFFEAARRLKEEYKDAIRFDVVGFFEEEYKTKVKALEDEGIICFHGFVEDPRPLYAQAHCLIQPSYHEGMSNVLLEAASIGRPLIASDIPGCREAVEQGVNGYLVPKMDVDGLVTAMRIFMELSSEEKETMGKCSRRKMEDEFGKEQVVKRTVDEIFRHL